MTDLTSSPAGAKTNLSPTPPSRAAKGAAATAAATRVSTTRGLHGASLSFPSTRFPSPRTSVESGKFDMLQGAVFAVTNESVSLDMRGEVGRG
ncbi:hypothetical protein Pcinc_044003 [Petrolisthes cinctipes]|uniref:Uncharacterized protein n=1 Tax=Petrolisthes cinctipes TaxID=88211 RepID=A0AAE1BHM7_PETCI|nr:hypothetical protein Pcinc_044003 [Petrolisthes cinctipes]